MSNQPRISIIIVNFNVKEYLEQLLISLNRALAQITHEIFVVDNASADGSAEHVRRRFPEVILIESKQNIGFGPANNLALKQACGEFIVMINPDTVVQEDTFEKLLNFFENQPGASAATCKIINPDGSFAVDCRHSIPTPIMALWKVLGLSKIFPRSKVFAKYNLTYLNPDDTYPVPAISGSFMMIKKEVLDKIGFFDERFFMYCEDIDLCHRINLEGFKIYYVPTTQIIHYKGESTKKNNIDYVITFNKALYQFFQKHYAQKTLFIVRWLIVVGIIARGVFVYLRNFLHENFPLILDTFILNAVIVLSFFIRLEAKEGFHLQDYFREPWIINLLSTIMFWGSAYYQGVYPHHRFSIQGIIKANILTFTLLASLTFFFKQFAYSRLVVIAAAFASPFFMILWRGILKRYYRGDKSAWGKDVFSKPTVIVGNGNGAVMLFQKIREMRDMSYDLLGVVTIGEDETIFKKSQIPVLGKIENLQQLISMHRVRQVIFSSEMLSYEKILKTMSEIGKPQLEYKIAPSNLEVVIGKSSIERLDDYPFLEIEYAIGKPFNRVTKRVFDVLISSLLLILGAPVMLPAFLIRLRHKKKIHVWGARGEPVSILQIKSLQSKSPLNHWLLWREVLRGKLSFVGAPIRQGGETTKPGSYWYKPGITGLVQINRKKIITPDDMEKYHLFYLKNQSILLDVEILLKSIFLRG
jgi:GT2 family glycosyltransferase/lipopolysaccharide/colanic/teichoic acid biosynthesis glycosyltransferase